MTTSAIYLDNNSTTPIDPRVVEAMVRAWQDCGANPASQHSLGRKARRMLEDAREGILELLGAKTGGMDADQLVFTSGGTEANNLAIQGLMPRKIDASDLTPISPGPNSPYLAISPFEHPSITRAAEELRRRGKSVVFLKVCYHGCIDRYPPVFNDDRLPHIISLILANNETGNIECVDELADICRESGTILHSDAVQAVGKIRVHFRELGVDAMTVTPHKFHGPVGIGALLLRHGNKLEPQLIGGFQQGGLRAGTENVALAVGFHEALKLALADLPGPIPRSPTLAGCPDRYYVMQRLRDQLEQLIQTALSEVVIISKGHLPNTSCLSFPGLDRQALVMALDLAGVACSTGSACASGSSEPSPTLVAMGLPPDVIQGAIRFSLSAFTTAEEVAEAARRIVKTVKHLRAQK